MVTIKDIDDTQITFSEGTLTNVEADAGGFLQLPWAVNDSHEDGNISEYTATGGTWEVKNTGAKTGTYAVSGSSGSFDAATDTGAHTWDALYRGNFSPPLYIEQWHYFPVTTAAQNLGISFGVSGVQDFYYLRYGPNIKIFELSKIVAGVNTALAQNTSVAAQSGWLRFTVLWEADGSITAKMYNSSGTLLITLGPVIDTTFSSGGAGMVVAQGSTDGAVRFDDLKIRKLTGNRVSPQLDLSVVGTVESSSVSWTQTLNGGTITIETRISTDNGATWSAWKPCTNGGAIPDLPYGTDASTALLECRQSLSTSDPTVTPMLDSLTLEISGEFGSFFMFPF